MVKLLIRPFEWGGTRLSEIGDHLTRVFPDIDDYEVARESPLPLSCFFPDSFQDAPERNHRLIAGTFFLDYLRSLSSHWLYNALDLGITNLPVITPEDGQIDGLAYLCGTVALVSANRAYFDEVDSETYIRSVVGTAVHEIGHIYGLEHHYSGSLRTKDNFLCSMDISYLKDRKNRGTKPPYLSSRSGDYFCQNCTKAIKMGKK